MKKQSSIIITLPEPCHESWDEMKPNNCGRFCDHCEKTVVDFTEMTDDEVVKIMTKSLTIPCGRFNETQLNREMTVPVLKPAKYFPYTISKVAASLLLIQTVVTNAFGQKHAPVSTTQNTTQKNSSNNQIDSTTSATNQSNIRTITGTVLDEKRERLIEADIKLKGTTTKTMTDVDGNFSIEVSGVKPVLEISAVGFTTQNITITGTGNSGNYIIQLKQSGNTLDEVVVSTPYGPPVTKSKYVGGGAEVITTKKIENTPVKDITKVIEGSMGSPSYMSSGMPGLPPTLIVRMGGVGSLGASTKPLIVVDGIPFDGDITSINPNEVAKTSILKGAMAASLYGAKGANGVILVTTKKAAAKHKFNFWDLFKSKKSENQ